VPLDCLIPAARCWVLSGRAMPPPRSRPDLWERLGLNPPAKATGLID
jgi:hypothetical protein